MKKEEILELLYDLPFVLFWPDNWDDIGFTEREIWVNSNGYGHIMCDEPTGHWEGEGLDTHVWQIIRNKLETKTLKKQDIQGTMLENLLEGLNYDIEYFEDDCQSLNEVLGGLLKLEKGPCGYIYALDTSEGALFFDSEFSFKKKYERDEANELWEDMDEKLLSTWIERLVKEQEPELQNWVRRNNLKI